MSDSLRVTDSVRLHYHGRGRFSWSSREHDHFIHPPISRHPPRDSPVLTPIEVNGKTVVIRDPMPRYRDRYVDDATCEEIGEFCLRHAPWSAAWLESDQFDFALDSIAESISPGGRDERVWSIVLAQMLCHPVLSEIDPYSVFGDGFYRVSNLHCPESVARAANAKSLCREIVGTYSAPLARALVAALSSSRDAPGHIAILGLCRGMAPEAICEVLNAGLTPVAPTLELRGLALDDDRHALVPWWVHRASLRRRVAWCERFDLLAECIRLSADLDHDVDEREMRTPDLLEIHDYLVTALQERGLADETEDDTSEHRLVSGPDEATTSRGTITPVITGRALGRIGLSMSLCCGSETYRTRLADGMSAFFVETGTSGAPITLTETDPEGRVIEIKGVANADLPPDHHDEVVGAISSAWF